MARTIQQIKDNMLANNSLNLSTSTVAEWSLWMNIVAIAIWTFENIVDNLKLLIDNAIESKQPGTKTWYGKITKEFQTQGNLVVNEKGLIVWDRDYPDKRIISNLSVNETVEGVVSIKVAKLNESGELIPLTEQELVALEQYLTKKKYAGTRIAVSSNNADLIKYNLIIYYDPSYNLEEIQSNVESAITSYKTNLTFDGFFYSTEFIKAITAVKGVITVKITSLQGKSSTGTYTNIDPKYELLSGYYNYDETSTVTYNL